MTAEAGPSTGSPSTPNSVPNGCSMRIGDSRIRTPSSSKLRSLDDRRCREPRSSAAPLGGALASQAATSPKTAHRRVVLLRVEDQARPSRPRRGRHVDAGGPELALRGRGRWRCRRVRGAALAGGRRRTSSPSRAIRASAIVSADSTNPPLSSQPSGSPSVADVAIHAESRVLECRERALLAHEGPAPDGRRPQDQVVDPRPAGDGGRRQQPAQAEPDGGDARHARHAPPATRRRPRSHRSRPPRDPGPPPSRHSRPSRAGRSGGSGDRPRRGRPPTLAGRV